MVSRVEKEQSNPQADLLVTLPPFIQKADKSGLLVASGVDTDGHPRRPGRARRQLRADRQQRTELHRQPEREPAAQDLGRPAGTPQYKGKLQYSTPGQAGDGTAVLILLQHLRGKPGALDYLTKLQANNVGPSSSTGKLQPKVSNGELLVANGDVQMNLGSIKDDGSKFNIFIPAAADGKRTTVSLPYVAGVDQGCAARGLGQEAAGVPAVRRRPEDRRARRARHPGARPDPHRRSRDRPHRTPRPRCSTASTCGCRTGTPCSPNSTPTWPPTRRPPGTDDDRDTGSAGTQTTADKAASQRSTGNRARRQSHSTGSGCPTGGAAKATRGADRLQPAGGAG